MLWLSHFCVNAHGILAGMHIQINKYMCVCVLQLHLTSVYSRTNPRPCVVLLHVVLLILHKHISRCMRYLSNFITFQCNTYTYIHANSSAETTHVLTIKLAQRTMHYETGLTRVLVVVGWPQVLANVLCGLWRLDEDMYLSGLVVVLVVCCTKLNLIIMALSILNAIKR